MQSLFLLLGAALAALQLNILLEAPGTIYDGAHPGALAAVVVPFRSNMKLVLNDDTLVYDGRSSMFLQVQGGLVALAKNAQPGFSIRHSHLTFNGVSGFGVVDNRVAFASNDTRFVAAPWRVSLEERRKNATSASSAAASRASSAASRASTSEAAATSTTARSVAHAVSPFLGLVLALLL